MNNFAIDLLKKLLYITPMMNDLMPTIEETATPDILAQIEHEEWQRGQEERERAEEWEAAEAEHGPLMTAAQWHQHCGDYNDYLGEAWKD